MHASIPRNHQKMYTERLASKYRRLKMTPAKVAALSMGSHRPPPAFMPKVLSCSCNFCRVRSSAGPAG